MSRLKTIVGIWLLSTVMFFVLSKIFAFLISPIVWVFALLLWSVLTKIETRSKKLRIVALILLYIFSNPFLVDEAFRSWEPVTVDHDLLPEKYEAAIILGGMGDVDLRLQKLNFGAGADRLLQTLRLYYEGKIKKIIFTGGSGSVEFPEKKEGIYVRKYLRQIHFPDSALIIESESRNTYENAINTKRILDSLHIKGKMFLVTSAFHMNRSLAIFKKAGYKELTPYVTNRASGVRRSTPDHLFIPNAAALMGSDLIIHEWLGYLIYKLRGYA